MLAHLVTTIFSLLKQQHATLSVAESCTGGGLAHAVTIEPGISAVFLGSITAYANNAKSALLNVDKPLIEREGAVSHDVALAMAINCRKVFGSTWSLSTTGIAGPTGNTDEKPLGLVYIGIAGPSTAAAHRFVFAPYTRAQHRQKTIEQALTLLLDCLRIS